MEIKLNNLLRRLSPATIVIVSFLFAIVVGMILLLLPCATVSGELTVIDAFFTATSAVCVTGLAVVDTGTYFTIFGQCVILLLIQVGGLGVMTISVTIFRLLGKVISFRQRTVMQEVFAHTPREDIFRLVKSIFLFTALTELAGAVLLSIQWNRDFSLGKSFYLSFFHSVSAFCNAGFSLFSDSMMRYQGNILVNTTICFLIIIGGIGFPVLFELYHIIFNGDKRRKLSVQTKTVLITTAVLIVVGAVVFWALEKDTTLRECSLTKGLMTSAFQSITCRTAGFNTVDFAVLSEATIAFMIFLMFVGASPGSCGGGVKTTSLALLTACSISRIIQHPRVNMFKKSIPSDTVTKNMSLILISFGLIAIISFLLLLIFQLHPEAWSHYHNRFLVCLFETVSAFGTVGVSMGITPQLTFGGKLLMITMMLIGRVGVLTFSYVIAGGGKENGLEYAEENIMIG